MLSIFWYFRFAHDLQDNKCMEGRDEVLYSVRHKIKSDGSWLFFICLLTLRDNKFCQNTKLYKINSKQISTTYLGVLHTGGLLSTVLTTPRRRGARFCGPHTHCSSLRVMENVLSFFSFFGVPSQSTFQRLPSQVGASLKE